MVNEAPPLRKWDGWRSLLAGINEQMLPTPQTHTGCNPLHSQSFFLGLRGFIHAQYPNYKARGASEHAL